MAALTIPKEFQPAIADIVTFDDSAFAGLLEAIKAAKLSFTNDDLLSNVTANIASIESDRVEAIIEVLTTLHFIRSGARVSLNQFVDDVLEGAAETDLAEVIAKSHDKAGQRLIALLSEKAIGFAAKAREKQRDFERSYCTAEMLTDIRPIFGNGDGSPIAAVLTHTLKISYHQREKLNDLFITLNSDDLEELDDIIQQARIESEQLGVVLDKAQIAYPKVLKEITEDHTESNN
jgi:hypothetical protein